jgi:hypothetical protein
MRAIVSTCLALSLTFTIPQIPRQPQSLTTEQIQSRWYMAEDGHAVKCVGRPYKIWRHVKGGDWEIRLAVIGCYGPDPQIILKD